MSRNMLTLFIDFFTKFSVLFNTIDTSSILISLFTQTKVCTWSIEKNTSQIDGNLAQFPLPCCQFISFFQSFEKNVSGHPCFLIASVVN